MSPDYAHCYRVLGISPGADWRDVKESYRSLVKKWHPDRFPESRNQRNAAEEKIKAITEAYRFLEEYHAQHGICPPIQPNYVTRASVEPQPAAKPQNAPTSSSRKNTGRRISLWPRRHATFGVMIIGIAVVVFYLVEDAPDTPAPINTIEESNPSVVGAEQTKTEPAVPEQTEARFTIGSTLGEVYTVQGTPTRTESNVWYYGQSKVYFTKGKVSRWDLHPDNPLKVIAPINDRTTLSFFTRGSSKGEVRAIQGKPTRESENLWEYGASQVVFSGDRVVAWRESPLSPLKVTK